VPNRAPYRSTHNGTRYAPEKTVKTKYQLYVSRSPLAAIAPRYATFANASQAAGTRLQVSAEDRRRIEMTNSASGATPSAGMPTARRNRRLRGTASENSGARAAFNAALIERAWPVAIRLPKK